MPDPISLKQFSARLSGPQYGLQDNALRLEQFKAALRDAHARSMASLSSRNADRAQMMSGPELQYLYGQDPGRQVTPVQTVPAIEPVPAPRPVAVAVVHPVATPQAKRKKTLEEEAAEMMRALKAEREALPSRPVAVQAALDRNPYDPGY